MVFIPRGCQRKKKSNKMIILKTMVWGCGFQSEGMVFNPHGVWFSIRGYGLGAPGLGARVRGSRVMGHGYVWGAETLAG
jgi:hypothetical protein